MKEYKIDLSGFDGKVRELVSEAIQRHAFELGYEWCGSGRKVVLTNSPYLFFNKSSDITNVGTGGVRYLEQIYGTLISAADFLALTPEDVQDEVVVITEPAEWLLVTGGESRRLVPMGATIRKSGSEPLNIEFFTRTVAERFLPKEGK
jgi:hypothetical protein